jgi:hypothetical protein
MTTEVIWAIIGFLLTVMVISYLAGDNPFFRLATYLFVGVTAGFVTLSVLTQVLWPRLVLPLLSGNIEVIGLTLVPLVLSVLLLLKISPRLARFGNIPLAYLVGIGAAVTISGAIFGTLFPQVIGTINLFDLQAGASQGRTLEMQLLVGLIILIGTVTTLMYFYFGARSPAPNQPPKRSALIETLAQAGQVFIGITLGALFAGVYSAALSALIERAASILNLISKF